MQLLAANKKFLILATCCVLIMVNAGVRLSFGIFIKPLQSAFDINRSSLSLVHSLFELGFGLSQLILGRLVDVRGSKNIMIYGFLMLSFSFALLSRVNNVWQLYLIYGLLVSFAAGSTSLVIGIKIIKNWFTSHSTLPISAATASVSVGQLISIPLISEVVTKTSWHTGYFYLSLASLISAILVFVGIQNHPAQNIKPNSKQGVVLIGKLEEILGSRSFWVFGSVFMVCGFGFSFIGTHLIPYAVDLHMEPRAASDVLALIGGVSILGTLITGYMSQTVSRKNIIFALFLIRCAAMGLLLFANSLGMIYVFAILIGITWTATVPLISDLSSERFGAENTGSVLGALFLIHQVGAAMGSYFGGLTSDYTHGYHAMFIVTAILDFVAAVLIFFYKPKYLIFSSKGNLSYK